MNTGYRKLLETLNAQCQQAASGVLHLYTVQNHYGRIGLVCGEINHVSLHTARSMTALPLLLNAAISSHRFEAGAGLPPMNDLLDTPDILAMLGCKELQPQTPPPAVAAVPEWQPPAPALAAAPQRQSVSAIELGIIEAELYRELGPMASSLVQECLPHADSALTLATALADQLMPSSGESYLARVTTLLRAVNTW
ncbi:MAG: hypothetical protein V4650_16335 [Pseudomonadota bacterium]